MDKLNSHDNVVLEEKWNNKRGITGITGEPLVKLLIEAEVKRVLVTVRKEYNEGGINLA